MSLKSWLIKGTSAFSIGSQIKTVKFHVDFGGSCWLYFLSTILQRLDCLSQIIVCSIVVEVGMWAEEAYFMSCLLRPHV